ncbi:uncharacterized protein BDR25DRAFT_82037 [Lindgomyces ingoldianus]|uniref:Uncharacterized protein n=1 Tax=Lindgomyces ingoldianus TaxID=673940 RepID=A0ACB6QG91_9PLEO|nr:uncharacterized protein BDR25DRAFT_82037 [Lindgomyces ingoldianus]KAF2466009.1 hypothetical protein BDR25DRAFT_82037 [Lindgomyces ingoldianus]
MAYQQYDNYQQPQQQQQQYYNQAPTPPGRQPVGYSNQQYSNQYDEYGYGQGQYEQYDGYYNEQQGGGRGNGHPQQQYLSGYNDMNGQSRQPPGHRPPPRDQYGQEPMYNEYQGQPRGPDPRGRPMGPNGGPVQGGIQRGDSRGRGNSRQPNLQQGPAGLKPQGRERPLLSPLSPMNLPQDNPFPTFPNQKSKPRANTGSMDEAMSLMSIGHDQEGQGRPQGPPQGRGRGQMGPPPGRGPPGRGGYGHPDMHRQDSGHGEAYGRGIPPPANRESPQQRPPPMNLEGSQRPPQRQYEPTSPMQQAFGPNTQRSQTMPQNMSGYDTQQQWAEPGPVAGYHGPESPTYIPPRPATAAGTKENGHGQPHQFEQRPPIPQPPPPQQHQHQLQQSRDDGRGDLDNLYDDYYGNAVPQDRQSKAASIDMPDFDAIPDSGGRHRRGYSIENHLSPTSSAAPMQGITAATAGPADVAATQGEGFYQQAARSRSQPDLHGQYAQGNGVYEMAGDAPAVPAVPNQYPPSGLPSGPRIRGPPSRAMTTGGQPQGFDPRFGRQQQPPLPRGYSDEYAYSEPGPQTMRNASPMVTGNPIVRPGTAAPAPGRMLSDPVQRRPGTTQPQRNMDALPSHPTPVRAGLIQQQAQPPVSQPQQARPPPVRQYPTDPTPASVGYGNQQMSSVPPQRASVSHPVTHDELNRLRNAWKFNPADNTAGLQLAKKLVEAASVLADENGTADTRTRNKNREKFVFEAHKIIKKLVASGYAEAMFYLADCYGQGLLGLQVDTKEAFTLYQSAAKAGHPASAYRTAVCCEMGHEEGGGTKKDPLKAVQWYRRAAALGDTPALYKMGMILLKGLLGQQRNLGEAINMLKRAADRADEQNPHALHELALLYEAQTGNERIIRDEAYALSLFQHASELGYKFSQFRLGQAYEYGLLGLQVDARSSISWYTRAAAQEEHQSELALSGWYLTGSAGILEQSDTEAYLWARKAACAEPPLPKALFAMGYFTEVGIGCPRSLEEAKRWYGRAAAYKFPKAQERLEELKRGGVKVQKNRERLSRSNQKQHEENCVVM